MGFFSSIVNFVKNVVKAVFGFVAKFMNSVFGSPVIAALAMLVLAICFIGPAAFMSFVSNPALLLVPGEGWILASLISNVLIQVLTLVCPSVGRAIGYAFGILSFIIGGMNIYSLYQTGGWSGLSMLSTWTSGMGGLEIGGYTLLATDMYAIFSIATLTSWLALVTAAADGTDSQGNPKSAYARAFVDGFFAVPEVVAGGADSATSALFGTASTAILWIGAGLLGYAYLSSDKTKVNVAVPVDKGEGLYGGQALLR